MDMFRSRNMGPRMSKQEYMKYISDKENREAAADRAFYYEWFWVMHCMAAILLLSVSVVVIVLWGIDDLKTRTYVTISALRKNPALPPKLFTDFEIIFTSRLGWTFVIPMICGLYHLVLCFPGWLIPRRAPCMLASEERELAESLLIENEYGQLKGNENPFYYAWFQKNLLFGASGIKFLVYGISSGLYTVLVSELVGITDFFQLSTNFLLIFFGFASLWNLEFSKSQHVHEVLNRTRSISRDVDEEDSLTQILLIPAETQAFIRDTIEDLKGYGFAFFLSIISIGLPFASVLVYFIIAVAEDSSGVDSSVYVAVSYFFIYIPVSLLLMLLFHMDVALSRNYMQMELILTTIHFIAYSAIILVVVLVPRDEHRLYGIVE
jgi:hypothetical protein